MSDQPKRQGRPCKTSEGKRPTLTFRCRGLLMEALKAEAAANDWSVSETIERALTRHFDAAASVADLRQIVREEIAAALARQAPDLFGGLYPEAASQIHGRDSLQA